MEHVRRISKKIFGATYRLEVMAALSAGDIITLTEFARRFSPPPGQSSVAKELQTLEEAKLIERQPSVEGMRSVYLKVVESPIWDTSRALAAQAEQQGGVSDTGSTALSAFRPNVETQPPPRGQAPNSDRMKTRREEFRRKQ